ncbi:MAG: ribonuclease III [Lachnospiraceae bacterium]|nr:ribonuclease III [Lachnospiraceae bacterium]
MEKAIKETFSIPDINPDQYSPLTLAYMGDCAYEIVIRTLLVHKGNTHVDRLNKRASNLAKAATQSQMITAIMEHLSEEEITMYKRGRNAKSYTSAKNASINDYRRATGFETLVGWLYLKGEFDRMTEIIRLGFEAIGADILEHTAENCAGSAKPVKEAEIPSGENQQ